jgi:hypothetical protein
MAAKTNKKQAPKKQSKADLELKKENKAIATIGPKWQQRQCLYIALECLNINFSWDENEVYGVIAQVEEGKDLEYMTKSFKRPANDLRILIFELALTERISKLPKGF